MEDLKKTIMPVRYEGTYIAIIPDRYGGVPVAIYLSGTEAPYIHPLRHGGAYIAIIRVGF
jgi:hypothetical protein